MNDQKPADEALTGFSQNFRTRLTKISLTQALGILIFISILLVGVGYAQYWNSQDRKYDIARPGNQQENKALDVTDQDENLTTPVDSQAIDKKLRFLQNEKIILDSMNKLESDNLSDKNLGLTGVSSPSL